VLRVDDAVPDFEHTWKPLLVETDTDMLPLGNVPEQANPQVDGLIVIGMKNSATECGQG
jgi:hypothetical protein